VIVENGTILYPKNSKKGRMQRIAFYWAYFYIGEIKNYEGVVKASLCVLNVQRCNNLTHFTRH